jgi:hypothetical protein
VFWKKNKQDLFRQIDLSKLLLMDGLQLPKFIIFGRLKAVLFAQVIKLIKLVLVGAQSLLAQLQRRYYVNDKM